MKFLRSRKDSLEFWLSFFLILGSAAGCIFCNGMDDSMKGELMAAESSMVTASVLLKLDFAGLFLAVLGRRLGEFFLLLLMAMSRAASFFFLGVSAYLGFSVSVMICAMTMDGGLLGIFRYLALIFPQGLFYGGIFYVVVWWMQEKEKQLTAAAAVVLLGAALLGAAAESFINPWIVAWMSGI